MIRFMKKSDLEQVYEIEHNCFSVPWAMETLRNGLKNPREYFWVWEQDGIIAGFSNMRIVLDEGELNRIVVRPAFRRQGIAKKLMDVMVAFSKENKVKLVLLEVRKSNITAQRLYRAYGFEEVAVRKNYYFDPEEDAVIMSLS